MTAIQPDPVAAADQDAAAPVVPPCPACARPLGLYFAECLTCFAHAEDFSYADYFPTAETGEPRD